MCLWQATRLGKRFFGSQKDPKLYESLRSKKYFPPSGNFLSGELAKPKGCGSMVHLQVPSLPEILNMGRAQKPEVGVHRKSPCIPGQWVTPHKLTALLVELFQCFRLGKPLHSMPSIPRCKEPRMMVLNFPPVKRNRQILRKGNKCSASCPPGFVNRFFPATFFTYEICGK